MTREEKQKALDALKKSAPIMAMTPNEFADYIQTLNKMADWLEQEPKIVPIAEIKFDDDMLHEIVKEAVKNIEIEPKWIPCSEKLPKKGKQVLCCNKYGSVFTSELTWSKGYLKFGQHYDVIAWQPLPQPYRAGSEG